MTRTHTRWWQRVGRCFSRSGWMIRLLGLSDVQGGDESPGLVLIQVDGLSFRQFQRALRQRNMPFLQRLVAQKTYRAHRLYTGVPSTTPAVQAALFYGVKTAVPAFSYRDRRSGQVMTMFSAEAATAVEEGLKRQGRPLLEGGSVYGGIFTGGAKERHFCVTTLGWGGFLKSLNPFTLVLTVLLNLHIVVRAAVLAAIELVLALLDCVRGLLSGSGLRMELPFIVLRVGICIVLREAVATGAKMDIARGMRAIHVNLAGYDEQAHHRGPASAFAHWSLRGIDRVIAQIWRSARRAPHRRYEVWIYSDHGQEEAVSYIRQHQRTVLEAVTEVFQRYAADTSVDYYPGIRAWRANLLGSRRFRAPAPELHAQGGQRVVVTAMGPLGHIYPPQEMSDHQRDELAQALVQSAGIPLVLSAAEHGKAHAWTDDGRWLLPDDAPQVLGARHPFLSEAAHDLTQLCHHPDAGPLIISGWRRAGTPYNFQHNPGAHAGPGPEETCAFALVPAAGIAPTAPDGYLKTEDLRDAACRVLST